MQRGLEPIRIINEKQRVVDIVFLTKLSEKYLSECSRIRGKEPNMKEVVCSWIDCSVQPILLVIDPDHALINRNVLGIGTSLKLEIGFLYPIVNGFSTPFDTQHIKNRDCIRK